MQACQRATGTRHSSISSRKAANTHRNLRLLRTDGVAVVDDVDFHAGKHRRERRCDPDPACSWIKPFAIQPHAHWIHALCCSVTCRLVVARNRQDFALIPMFPPVHQSTTVGAVHHCSASRRSTNLRQSHSSAGGTSSTRLAKVRSASSGCAGYRKPNVGLLVALRITRFKTKFVTVHLSSAILPSRSVYFLIIKLLPHGGNDALAGLLCVSQAAARGCCLF